MTTNINKTYLLISLYVIFLIAIAFFGLSPVINNLKTSRTKLSDKQAQLDASYRKMEVLQKDSKHPEEFKTISEKVKNYWPDNLDVSYFIVQTENLAKSNSLIIENFSVDQPKTVKSSKTALEDDKAATDNTSTKKDKKNTPNNAQFTFTSKSAYGSILSLIKGLENLPRFNSVSMISLSGSESGQIDLRLTGNIYYGK